MLRHGNAGLFFSRWVAQWSWFAPRQVCSWCQAAIAPGGFFSHGKISHGVCSSCSARALEEHRVARRLRGVLLVLSWAALFFAADGCSKRSAEVEQVASVPVYRPVVHQAVTSASSSRPSVEVIP